MAKQKTGKQARVSIPWPSYIRDGMGLYMDLMNTQAQRAQAVFERMAGGEYKADDWAKDTAMLWGQGIRDAFQLLDSFQGSAMRDAVPTGVFILDAKAEGADAKELPIVGRLKEGDVPVPTPLTCVDDRALDPIPAGKITVTPNESMNRLTVAFKGIAGIPAGRYIGWVYLESSKAPLAAIHLVKLAGERGSEGADAES